ncbi:hypothetical protein [Marinobacterium rhizophilum]|uniref:DUF4468 domain-containing protein n=1 Tax=Marinobacterium rhizophilum TaxID=420402 RepID=A0ABY5HLJ0_9GAMM|nr:hypothetical protein [Marinobacterium rhizophilum]UTW13163.1 hypothetical protein KDW95_05740 [Marinobacterium rhizophilum]
MLNNKWKLSFLMILIVGLMSGCTQQNYKPSKTSLELQSIQKREFDTTYKVAFASALSVFQDKGYVVDTADSSTGFITAESNKSSGFVPFVGQTIEYTKSTAFIEVMPSSLVAIRLNFVKHQETSSGYGMKGGNSVPIEAPEFYQGVFEDIQKAIFVRTSQ